MCLWRPKVSFETVASRLTVFGIAITCSPSTRLIATPYDPAAGIRCLRDCVGLPWLLRWVTEAALGLLVGANGSAELVNDVDVAVRCVAL